MGDHDRLATLRELAALLGASPPGEAHADSPWSQRRRSIFGREQISKPDVAPYVMIGLTPTFPLDPIAMDETSDATFERFAFQRFHEPPFLVRLEHGIMHVPCRDEATRTVWGEDQAFDDGSIGVAINLHPGASNDDPAMPWSIDLLHVWQTFHHPLTWSALWPRRTLGYDGPLLCGIALVNIANVVVHVSQRAANPAPPWRATRSPGERSSASGTARPTPTTPSRRSCPPGAPTQFPNHRADEHGLRQVGMNR